MDKPELDTEIDELLQVLSEKNSVTLDEASKLLGVKVKTMQVWVDSLVEEKIISLDYDFLTPIIKLTPEKKKEYQDKKKEFDRTSKENRNKKIGLKGNFLENAKRRNITIRKIPILWKRYVEINETLIKKEFMEKAEKRMIEGDLEAYWTKFIQQYKRCDRSECKT